LFFGDMRHQAGRARDQVDALDGCFVCFNARQAGLSRYFCGFVLGISPALTAAADAPACRPTGVRRAVMIAARLGIEI
jgi:hypothetical protein